jgi:hypothetical protein
MKRRTLLGVLSLLPVTLGASGEGPPPSVHAGNVELLSIVVAHPLEKRRRLKRRFEQVLVRELAHLDVRAKVGLSASLLVLESHRRANQVETRCVVSAVVHAQPSGDIRAILRGQASVQTAPGDRDGEAAALEAAVAGALQRVPDAVA